ncbi:hypothetical protein K501DRAFT_201950 [Backusella circina FSU 941]|nr:hypothetical protein K501DRAFT_201950 [Backusella circina FSU 941]
MTHLCSCMNATENVRGINFRLTFPEPSIYASAITIEFDNRYNLLHHFSSTSITIPPSYPSPPPYAAAGPTRPTHAYYPNEKSQV